MEAHAVKASAELEAPPVDTIESGIPDPVPAGLTAQVSATVARFLAQQSAMLQTPEEGRDMSSAQQKKRDNKAKSEEREAKWRAKGIPVGVNRRTARARGPGRPGSVKPRGKRR